MIVHSNAKDGKLVFHKFPVNELGKGSKGREDCETVALQSVALHFQSAAFLS